MQRREVLCPGPGSKVEANLNSYLGLLTLRLWSLSVTPAAPQLGIPGRADVEVCFVIRCVIGDSPFSLDCTLSLSSSFSPPL